MFDLKQRESKELHDFLAKMLRSSVEWFESNGETLFRNNQFAALADRLMQEAKCREQLAQLLRGRISTSLQSGDQLAVHYTSLERRVIDALADGPKTKYELTLLVFGCKGNQLSLENRLKQILFRVRKKTPGLIELRDQKYVMVLET